MWYCSVINDKEPLSHCHNKHHTHALHPICECYILHMEATFCMWTWGGDPANARFCRPNPFDVLISCCNSVVTHYQLHAVGPAIATHPSLSPPPDSMRIILNSLISVESRGLYTGPCILMDSTEVHWSPMEFIRLHQTLPDFIRLYQTPLKSIGVLTSSHGSWWGLGEKSRRTPCNWTLMDSNKIQWTPTSLLKSK